MRQGRSPLSSLLRGALLLFAVAVTAWPAAAQGQAARAARAARDTGSVVSPAIAAVIASDTAPAPVLTSPGMASPGMASPGMASASIPAAAIAAKVSPSPVAAREPVALRARTRADTRGGEQGHMEQGREAASRVGADSATFLSVGRSLPSTKPAPWWAPVASAVIPGMGQLALGQERSVAYLVADAYLLVQYFTTRRDANNERSTYRRIVNEVARQPYGGSGFSSSWDYYEILETFLESGVYDRVPGGAIEPETDPDTYNGYRWLQARETYWYDPDVPPPVESAEYQRAIAFYLRYAIPEEFRWSWRDAQLQQDVYRQAIRSANRSYQRAVNLIGLVAMNHLASMIDAYVSVRVRRFGSVGGLGVAQVHTRVLPLGDPAEGRQVWQAGLTLSR